jgi:cytochrome c oxidase assembly factor CtaG
VALPLFVATTWLWHAPAAYELALRSSGWHYLQHVCFLVTGLLFWYPVVRPYPSHPRWSTWLLLPYLILADVQNTGLSALLTFSSKVLYPYYLQVPRLGGLSALEDQAAAGVLMWVPGSLAYLLPLFGIGFGSVWTGQGQGGAVGSEGKSLLVNENSPERRVPRCPLPTADFHLLIQLPTGTCSASPCWVAS